MGAGEPINVMAGLQKELGCGTTPDPRALLSFIQRHRGILETGKSLTMAIMHLRTLYATIWRVPPPAHGN